MNAHQNEKDSYVPPLFPKEIEQQDFYGECEVEQLLPLDIHCQMARKY